MIVKLVQIGVRWIFVGSSEGWPCVPKLAELVVKARSHSGTPYVQVAQLAIWAKQTHR